MTVGSLRAAARPQVLVGQAHIKIGAVGSGVVQAIKVTIVQEAQVLIERRVVQLPVALGISAVGTSRGEDRLPEQVHRHLGAGIRVDLVCPGGHRRTGDAPGVDVEVEATAELRALRVLGARGSSGLCRIHALERLGVRALHKNEASTGLCERIELLTLPSGNGLKERNVDVLVG